MKRTLASVAVTTLIAVPFSVQAQFAKIEDAVKYHQSSPSMIRKQMRHIGAVVREVEPYNKAAFEVDVANLEMVLRRDVFTTGSYIANSKGQSEIWKEQDEFKAAAEKTQTEAEKLTVAAKSGDLNTITVVFGAVTQSCKACHENYRSR